MVQLAAAGVLGAGKWVGARFGWEASAWKGSAAVIIGGFFLHEMK